MGPRILVLEDLAELEQPELFVLTVRDAKGVQQLELRDTGRSGIAAVAFSTLAELVTACGWGQPWALLKPERLGHLALSAGAIEVAIDVPVPEGHRYPVPDESERPELEPLDETGDDDLFFIPSRPVHGADRQVVFELQPDARGRRTLLAFTSEAALRAGCGPHQAWVSILADRMGEAALRSGAERVLFNPTLAEKARHQGPVLDWTRSDNEP